jgi:hypothetical protein
MVERIDEMPAGTIGFRASGKLTPEDYRNVLVPTLREAVDSGEVRMLFVLSDFEELEPRAWLEDAKTASSWASSSTRPGSGRRSSATPTGSRRPSGCSPG